MSEEILNESLNIVHVLVKKPKFNVRKTGLIIN